MCTRWPIKIFAHVGWLFSPCSLLAYFTAPISTSCGSSHTIRTLQCMSNFSLFSMKANHCHYLRLTYRSRMNLTLDAPTCMPPFTSLVRFSSSGSYRDFAQISRCFNFGRDLKDKKMSIPLLRLVGFENLYTTLSAGFLFPRTEDESSYNIAINFSRVYLMGNQFQMFLFLSRTCSYQRIRSQALQYRNTSLCVGY